MDDDNNNGHGTDRINGDLSEDALFRDIVIRPITEINHDKSNDVYYFTYPPGYKKAGKRFCRRDRCLVELEIERLNRAYATRSSTLTGVPLWYLEQCAAAYEFYREIQIHGRILVSEIFRDRRDGLALAAIQPHLTEVRGLYHRHLKKRGKGNPKADKLIAAIKQMALPDLRLPCPGDDQAIRKFIADIIRFIRSQWNRETGRRWDPTTCRNWVLNFQSMVNRYNAQKHSAAVPFPYQRLNEHFCRDTFDPEIFYPEEIELFMLYLLLRYRRLFVPFVLSVKAGLRTSEISGMRFEYIVLGTGPGNGVILVPEDVTDKSDPREILETDLPEEFALLRAHRHLLGAPGDYVIGPYEGWIRDMSQAWFELFGTAWRHNAGRHTTASALLGTLRKMSRVADIVGHRFRLTDRTLIKHYRKMVRRELAQRIRAAGPLRPTRENIAGLKWRMYRASLDLGAPVDDKALHPFKNADRTPAWHPRFLHKLRETRPIVAERRGKTVIIDLTTLDGQRKSTRIECATEGEAKQMQHRICIASATGRGVIDTDTGAVAHYERNHGLYHGQRLYRLLNPDALEAQLIQTRTGRLILGRRIGWSMTFIRRLTDGRKEQLVPETVMHRLREFAPALEFEATGRTVK